MAIQRVAARALGHPDAPEFSRERAALFKNAGTVSPERCTDLGYKFQLPRASYYFWVHIPEPYSFISGLLR